MSNIHRNDPCPCGSGKKYKKCCGKTEAQLVQERHKGLKSRIVSQPAASPVQNFAKKVFKVLKDTALPENLSEHSFSKGPLEKKEESKEPTKTLEGLIGLEESDKS